ncbi:MAG: hypothetical protein P0116_12355 [Candidatus Nitrosocosmicus sp.]|nr:hypothetical protein [Candidatus Nitrosocosmicus sp.]
MNYGYKFAILSILTLTIAMFSGDSSKVEDVLAQKGNTLGQEGEGNDAFKASQVPKIQTRTACAYQVIQHL